MGTYNNRNPHASLRLEILEFSVNKQPNIHVPDKIGHLDMTSGVVQLSFRNLGWAQIRCFGGWFSLFHVAYAGCTKLICHELGSTELLRAYFFTKLWNFSNTGPTEISKFSGPCQHFEILKGLEC